MNQIVLTNTEGEFGVEKSVARIREGASAMDAIEDGIKLVERDPRAQTVGYNGKPNIVGEVECDAAIMCGRTRRTGAVGAVRGYLHVVTLARQVMERLPHVFLVAHGAERFAREIGMETMDMLHDEAKTNWRKWIDENLPPEIRGNLEEADLAEAVWKTCDAFHKKGTTTFMALDRGGDIAAATSTSGWAYKYPGRLGDSPVIGAGVFADNRYGAATCTHAGEMTIRAATSVSVVKYMRRGATVEAAVMEAMQDQRDLQGGYKGPAVIHAIDNKGNYFVASRGTPEPRVYWVWQEGMDKPEAKRTVPVE